MAAAGGGGAAAQATLEPRSGSAASGTVSFVQLNDSVTVKYEIRGLTPGAEHGFHVHEKGDCSAADASSAGGHFNPGGKPHGHPAHGERHLGDLPNVRANEAGVAWGTARAAGLTIGGSDANILGLSIVVHRDPDDYRSQPAGNSGPRIACGVIRGA
jgi:superoxide dismutase, Cu-Zn family